MARSNPQDFDFDISNLDVERFGLASDSPMGQRRAAGAGMGRSFQGSPKPYDGPMPDLGKFGDDFTRQLDDILEEVEVLVESGETRLDQEELNAEIDKSALRKRPRVRQPPEPRVHPRSRSNRSSPSPSTASETYPESFDPPRATQTEPEQGAAWDPPRGDPPRDEEAFAADSLPPETEARSANTELPSEVPPRRRSPPRPRSQAKRAPPEGSAYAPPPSPEPRAKRPTLPARRKPSLRSGSPVPASPETAESFSEEPSYSPPYEPPVSVRPSFLGGRVSPRPPNKGPTARQRAEAFWPGEKAEKEPESNRATEPEETPFAGPAEDTSKQGSESLDLPDPVSPQSFAPEAQDFLDADFGSLPSTEAEPLDLGENKTDSDNATDAFDLSNSDFTKAAHGEAESVSAEGFEATEPSLPSSEEQEVAPRTSAEADSSRLEDAPADDATGGKTEPPIEGANSEKGLEAIEPSFENDVSKAGGAFDSNPLSDLPVQADPADGPEDSTSEEPILPDPETDDLPVSEPVTEEITESVDEATDPEIDVSGEEGRDESEVAESNPEIDDGPIQEDSVEDVTVEDSEPEPNPDEDASSEARAEASEEDEPEFLSESAKSPEASDGNHDSTEEPSEEIDHTAEAEPEFALEVVDDESEAEELTAEEASVETSGAEDPETQEPEDKSEENSAKDADSPPFSESDEDLLKHANALLNGHSSDVDEAIESAFAAGEESEAEAESADSGDADGGLPSSDPSEGESLALEEDSTDSIDEKSVGESPPESEEGDETHDVGVEIEALEEDEFEEDSLLSMADPQSPMEFSAEDEEEDQDEAASDSASDSEDTSEKADGDKVTPPAPLAIDDSDTEVSEFPENPIEPAEPVEMPEEDPAPKDPFGSDSLDGFNADTGSEAADALEAELKESIEKEAEEKVAAAAPALQNESATLKRYPLWWRLSHSLAVAAALLVLGLGALFMAFKGEIQDYLAGRDLDGSNLVQLLASLSKLTLKELSEDDLYRMEWVDSEVRHVAENEVRVRATIGAQLKRDLYLPSLSEGFYAKLGLTAEQWALAEAYALQHEEAHLAVPQKPWRGLYKLSQARNEVLPIHAVYRLTRPDEHSDWSLSDVRVKGEDGDLVWPEGEPLEAYGSGAMVLDSPEFEEALSDFGEKAGTFVAAVDQRRQDEMGRVARLKRERKTFRQQVIASFSKGSHFKGMAIAGVDGADAREISMVITETRGEGDLLKGVLLMGGQKQFAKHFTADVDFEQGSGGDIGGVVNLTTVAFEGIPGDSSLPQLFKPGTISRVRLETDGVSADGEGHEISLRLRRTL